MQHVLDADAYITLAQHASDTLELSDSKKLQKLCVRAVSNVKKDLKIVCQTTLSHVSLKYT